jgi:hypothetical protein
MRVIRELKGHVYLMWLAATSSMPTGLVVRFSQFASVSAEHLCSTRKSFTSSGTTQPLITDSIAEMSRAAVAITTTASRYRRVGDGFRLVFGLIVDLFPKIDILG